MRRNAKLMGLPWPRCHSPCSSLGRDPSLCHATTLPTLAGMACWALNLPEHVRKYYLVHFLAASTKPGWTLSGMKSEGAGHNVVHI